MLPDGWSEMTVEAVSVLVQRGRAPVYTEDGLRVFNQRCVRDGRVVVRDARRTDTSVRGVPEWALLQVGDTVINSTGVGTLGRAALVSALAEPSTVDSHVTIVRPNPEVIAPGYLAGYLRYRESDLVSRAGGSTGQAELSRDAIKSLPILVPPLPEQRRITDLLDAVDAAIEAAMEHGDAVGDARQALLSDIESKCSGYGKLALGRIASKIGSGATPRGGEAAYQSSGVALIRSQNVRHLEFGWTGLAHLDAQQAEQLANVAVQPRDVLINITGASVTRVCLAPESVLPARVNQHVCIIRPDATRLLPGFLMALLAAPHMKSFLLGIATAGTSRQALTRQFLASLEVPVPPMSEQTRFVRVLDELAEVAEKSAATLSSFTDLRSNLLGELVSGEHRVPPSYDWLLATA